MRDRQLMRLRLAIVTAALIVAGSAAHALTMNTLANPDGGASYVDPADRVENMTKGKSTTAPGVGGFQFSIGPSDAVAPGSIGRFGGFGSGNRNIGAPPDQSRFNDR